MHSDVLRFDRYELQLRERCLLRDGHEVPLRAKAFDVLVALVQRAGRLVTKNELLEVAWPGLVVEENNVAAQIVALRKALDGDLIVTVPGFGYRFQVEPANDADGAIQGDAPPAAPFAAAPPPEAPRLYGRDAELDRLAQGLAGPGCLTLVGPGGVGKTALARALRAGCSGPSEWVDLAELDRPDQVLPSICRALGQPTPVIAAVSGALRALRLLVLDNAEHVVEAVAAHVPALLAAAPELRILVTSQMPLAIGGEQVERIEPLAQPSRDLPDETAMTVGAMALFVQRIREADARFRFTAGALPLLRRLCDQLDGLPLVLEMAAARVPLLGLQRVQEALAERFALLRKGQRDTPARHRTLQAALDWSYRLLDPGDQRVFRALGAFVGGFTPELAAKVAGAEAGEGYWDTVDRLALLVDRSLVSSNHDDPPRYHLLETMRSFAAAQLAAAGEEDAVRARHAAAFDALLADAAYGPATSDDDRPLHLVLAEMANVREAIGWAMRRDPALALRLSAHAADVAVLSVWRSDARAWLADCRPLADRTDIDVRWRAPWWQQHATQLLHASGIGALDAARHAIEVCRAAGDDWQLAQACATLVWGLSDPDDEAERALAEANALCDRHPEWSPRLRCRLTGAEAHMHETRPDHAAALEAYRRQAEQARTAGMRRIAQAASLNVANMQRQLGLRDEALVTLRTCRTEQDDPRGYIAAFSRVLGLRILFELGRHDEALDRLQAVLAAARLLDIASALEVAALGLAQAGRPRAAALMIGHLERRFVERGTFLGTDPHCDVPRARALVAERLDAASIESLVEQGRGLDDAGIDALLQTADERP